MEMVLTLTLILLRAELFEALTQGSSTLLELITRLYAYYDKSIFLFFLMQPGFYVLLFIIMWTGVLNASIIGLLAVKVFDIFYKIELINKVFIKHEVPVEMEPMLKWKIPSWFFLMGATMYPLWLYYALV